MKKIYLVLLLVIIIINLYSNSLYAGNNSSTSNTRHLRVTISAIGDCTLGRDSSFGYGDSFDDIFKREKGNYGYFFSNVKAILEKDDLTIANLEGTFTEAVAKAQKKFRFKGSPSYVNILKAGSVETVNLANNHSHDYLQQGYEDTIKNLKKSQLGYFGYDNRYVTEIKGVKIGMLGYTGFSSNSEIKKQIAKDISYLKQNCNLVIVSFHWGEERKYYPNATQRELAHFAIDSGANLVLGHHPHVLQGIEEYKGACIVYSLGNFCFGGNKNPQDKDTIIYQHTFIFDHSKNLLKDSYREIIPCSISSKSSLNDYKPTVLSGKEKDRVMERLKKYSTIF